MQVPTTPARPARPDSRTTSSTQPAAGPSSSSTQAATTPAAAAAGSGSGPARADDLWTEILRGADRQKSLSRKNVVLLSERHRGRRNLLSKLVGKRRAREAPPPALAIGYDVLEHADRDEGTCAGRRGVDSQLSCADIVCRRRTPRVRLLPAIITPGIAASCRRVSTSPPLACELPVT